MNAKIYLTEAPAGSGKTTWAFKEMSESTNSIIYCAKTKDLNMVLCKRLDDISSSVDDNPRNPFSNNLYVKIDGDTSDRTVSEQLNDYSLSKYKVIFVTHESIKKIPTELAKNRHLIIDEIPNCFTIEDLKQNNFDAFIESGLIQIKNKPAFSWPTTDDSYVIALADKGKNLLKIPYSDKVEHSKQEILTKIFENADEESFFDKKNEVIISNHIPIRLLNVAFKTTVLAASAKASLFHVWAKLLNLEVIPEQPQSIELEVNYPNTEIFYLVESNKLSSKSRLFGISKRTKLNKQSPIERMSNQLKHAFESTGQLSGMKKRKLWIIALNQEKNKKSDSNNNLILKKIKNILSIKTQGEIILDVNIRGSNKYKSAILGVYLGAARWKRNHVLAIQNILENGADCFALEKDIHIENIYQFCMRTKLRESSTTNVKLVVPTSQEAILLAKRMNIDSSKIRKL